MADKTKMTFTEIGSGDPVVVLGGKEAVSPLVNELSRHNRVLTIDQTGAGRIVDRALAGSIAQALTEFGVDRYSVIGLSEGALIAIELAIFSPKPVKRLILISPPAIAQSDAELYERLANIEAPALVMIGTRDRSGAADSARILRSKMRSCHLSLIYDAGRDLISDRPQACIAPIGEFLESGEEFIVCRESQMIRP
ncbi:MAG: alpha/beta fold hydrolase [Candidatus Binataceae bacterium]